MKYFTVVITLPCRWIGAYVVTITLVEYFDINFQAIIIVDKI